MADDSEWLKLPAEDKCQHKVWKARVAGYEEATKFFHAIDDEKSPDFNRYAGLMKKFVTDSNAVAQEKAMDAVLVFVENAAVAGRVCADVLNGIIAKCLNVSKQKTKEKAMEIIMLYIEIEKKDIVQECLIQGLENKQPKVVVGCIVCLRMALRDYGSKVMTIKPILKTLPKLLEDRDKNVREETKLLIIEVYRWIGAALKPQMSHFKPLQVTELEAEFEKLPSGKPQQTRFLRSQQDLKVKMEEQAAAGGGDGTMEEADDAAEEIDPYELMESVDIIASLPKDFFDKLEAKKWQERREALDALDKLTENAPKIDQGDFGNLVRALLKVIGKDSNILLVTLAAKCLAGIARGLRKKFVTYGGSCVSVILEKFKEKKPTVVAALKAAIDAVYLTISLDTITEDCLATLDNKNPNIRAETAAFLARCFSYCSQSTLPKKQLKVFCAGLLKAANDTTPEVREASFQALGTAMKVVSEKNIGPYVTDVESMKMQKIQECCQKAVLLNAKGEPRSGGGGAAPAKPTESKPVSRPAKPTSSAASNSKAASNRPQTAPAGGKKVTKKKGATDKKGSKKVEEDVEMSLTDEAVVEKTTLHVPPDTLAQIESNNWKERLAGMEVFTEVLKGLGKDDIPCQAFVRTINKKPGLKDTNFQVLKLRIELVAHLARKAVFSKRSAEFCLPELVEKLGDVKNGKTVKETLTCITEAINLEFVGKEVIKSAFEQKNPKNQSEALNWMADAIKDFGFKFNIKPMLEYIKKAFAATNPAVRTCAITLIGVMYMYMGHTLRVLFEDEKPALLQQIDAEIEKVKGQKPPPPTRGLTAGDEEEGEDEADASVAEEVCVADLIPRNDIGEKLTPELLAEMSDKNWKIRNEALQKVVAILNEAKFIMPNLGQLPDAIKSRLTDVNKMLVNASIGICLTLANGLGPHCKVHVKTIGPALLGCFTDGKPHIRAAAVSALNAWVENTTLTPLVEVEAFSDALKIENPNLRQELLGWLSEKLPPHRQLPVELKMCVPHLLSCLEDRNADVRKKAQDALVPFMIHTTYEAVYKATSKLKPASKDQILGIIEKAKANIPAKPVKAKKAKQPPKEDPEPPTSQPARPSSAASSDSGCESKPANKVTTKSKAKPAPTTSKKKKEEEDTGPSMSNTIPKEQRFKDEKNMKVLKWNFLEPRLEYVDQLKLQMERNFSKSLFDQLFHSDFKLHIKAIELLIKCISSLQEATVGNLDLILKWLTLRFFDTNPSMLNKALEYLRNLFAVLADIDYHLTEIEATSFIPYLVTKVGHAKDNVRRDVRTIFKLLYKICPASKMFTHLIDGLKSKNSKQRTECLEELGSLIESYGITICQPSPAQSLKIIAQQIGDRDTGVRNAALNTVVTAYMILGDAVFKFIGILNDKDQSLLEERIKRSMKNKNNAKPVAEERPKTTPVSNNLPTRSTSQGNLSSAGHNIPKSASLNLVKKEGCLDIDEQTGPQPAVPNLMQFDLEEMYQPVTMPKIMARPPSPALKLFNSPDASTSVGYVISQITSTDITVCIKALAQIDSALKDESCADIFSSHVDQFLLAMSMQFKMAYSTHMEDTSTSKDEVIRLYRCLMGTLLETFQHSSLAVRASKDILRDLIQTLVTILLDSRLLDVEEGPQVIRSVNVMIVKIVEKADHTNIMSALIRLLQGCLTSETCSFKFIELIMKCLWKMIRMIPNIIEYLNLERILYDIHLFMKAFPSSSWKDRQNDLPLRTVKTMLHTLAMLKSQKIMTHLGMIGTDASEVKLYLQKALKNDTSSTTSEEMNGTDEPKTPKGTKNKRLSKSTHDMLAEIFKKIGSKENTIEGLNDLYDFKQKYTEADLHPFLKKSSQFFQDYIERGLRKIEADREGKKTIPATGGSVSIDTGGCPTPSKATDATGEKDYYLERLRVLRSKCGLDNASTEKAEPVPVVKVVDPEPEPKHDADSIQFSITDSMSSLPKPEKPSTNASIDVLALKERLERVKRLAKT